MAGTPLTPGNPGTPVDGQWVHYPAGNAGDVARWDENGAIFSSSGWVDIWAGDPPSAISGEFSGLLWGSEIAEHSSSSSIRVMPVQTGDSWTLQVLDSSGNVLGSTSWDNTGQRISIGYDGTYVYVSSGTMEFQAPRTGVTASYFCFPEGPRMRDVVVGTWPLDVPPSAPVLSPASQTAYLGDTVLVSWTHDPDGSSEQTAYELETSTDNGTTWVSTGEVESSASYATVGPYSTPGDVLVRVRTWSTAPDPSGWSSNSVVRYVNPPEGVMALTITDGPTRAQTPYGLLAVATDRSATVDRWPDGLTWPTISVDSVSGAPGDPCEDLDPATGSYGWSSATPFFVRSRFDCGLGIDEKEDIASLQMASLAHLIVEDQVWNGTLGAVPYLASDDAEELTATAMAPATAVGLVDQYIGQSYGSLGVIHMTRQTADVAFAAGVLEVRSGRLVTGLGTPVAVYSTTGAGPGGEEPEAQTAWIYGTPAVSYWTQALPPQNRVNISNNEFSSELVRRWAVGWDDTGVGAALVDLT